MKHAEEMGDAKEEHLHVFALNPPPRLEQIRESALRLQTPERRIVDEFFWFWPMKWGDGKQDPALLALAKGDKSKTYNIWTKLLTSDRSEKNTISKHNLAIMFHLTALENELLNLKASLSNESLSKIDQHWRMSFKLWEELTENETFWSLISTRIRILDDPQLTTGFTRRMRATFPEALDKINGLLALQYMEDNRFDLASRHIVYMKETHQGFDNIPKTLAMITQPLQTRIRDAVFQATQIADKEPRMSAQAAKELFMAVSKPLKIIKGFLSPNDHDRITLCDIVAESGLACADAHFRIEHNFEQCLEILKESQKFAESKETRNKISDDIVDTQNASLLNPINQLCEQVYTIAQEKPEKSLEEAQQLLDASHEMIARINASHVPDEIKNRAKDRIAGTLMQCAIIHGNKTHNWKPCVRFFTSSLLIAADTDLKKHILNNQHIADKNIELFSNLKPISAAPSLSAANSSTGFKLIGASDHDTETESFLSTHYFVFFYIPLFPIGRYRVVKIPNGYRFLGKVPLRNIDKWHLFISLGLIALAVFSMILNGANGKPSHSSTPSLPPSSNVKKDSPPASSLYQRQLADEIETGKVRAKEMAEEIEDMDGRLEDYERRMKMYNDTYMTDEYNNLVQIFNALVNERQNLFEEYSSLIDEVNSKVNRFNSGER